MNIRPILPVLGLLLTLPLSAGTGFEASLLYDRLACPSQSADPAFQVRPNAGFGLMVGYTPMALGEASLTLTATYRPGRTSDFQGDGQTFARTRIESQALGARVAWHRAVDFGFDLEVRNEDLKLDDGAEFIKASTLRPWIGAFVGYTFPAQASVRPFVALGGAFPLTRTSFPDAFRNGDDDKQALKSLAPESRVYLQMGGRF